MKVRLLSAGLCLAIGGFFVSESTFATTYSHDTTVQFTFNSEISVVIDTADIEILDLAPGTSSDSNVVGITISTNNVVGYTASATVGNATYNTTSMVHTNGTNAFTSIAENASEASLSTDNTWGYTTSLDNGSSWANLSGLPIYTDTAKEIAKTTSPASDAIKFKINAKAATSQAAGDYKNVINFTVVANVPPKTLEDVLNENPNNPKDPETNLHLIQSINDEVCEATEAINDPIVVTDIRDHKNYRVVKLKDGNCWMQDNLALDLTMANASSKITSSNTNANSAALNALFGVANRDASTDPNGNLAVAGIAPYVANDYASDRPMIYTEAQDDTNDQDEIASVQNSKFGVYYNQCAASAGSFCYSEGGSGNGDKADTAVDIEYDVCPSNWRLPTSDYYYGYYPSESYDVDGGELHKLYEYYYDNHGAEIREDLLLPIAGQFSFPTNSLQNVSSNGNYWAATSKGNSGGMGYWLSAEGDYINPRNSYPAVFGNNIRCIVKTSKIAINFDKGDGYGDMSPQLIKRGNTVKLDKNQYARWDYLFNGWNTKADGTGVGYKDGDTFTATETSATKIKLYAQWVEDTGQGSSSLGKTLQDAYEAAYVSNPGQFPDGNGTKHGLYVPDKDPITGNYTGTYHEATSAADYEGIPAKDLRFAMQDINLEINGVKVCDYATVIGSEAYVLDLRDYKSYWIAKLADGKCWMTQNLDLNLETTPNNVATLTSLNTDLNTYGSNGYDSNNGYSQTNNIITWVPERSTIAPSSISNSGSISGYANDDNNPYSVDPGDWYWTDSWYASTINIYLDIAGGGAGDKFKQTPYTGNGEHGHVGNYYNWSAAVASNNASSYASSTYDDITNNPQNSICPKGWRLPIITSYTTGQQGSNDFYNLANKYGNVNSTDSFITASPVYFVRSGNISSNSQYTSGYGGRYWTSTVMRGGSSTYHLYFHSGSIYFTAATSRGLGFSVRCVAR